MDRAVLIFPDNFTMADYILDHQIVNVETNSREHSLQGNISDDNIVIACTEYKAILSTMIQED